MAKQSPEMAFTSLAYLMDIDWLAEAYRRTRKNGAVGVDGVTAEDYEEDLEGNLQRLLDRAKSGTYKAPPVRRVHIPKGGSSTETRPLGIPTLEDKVLQRAIVQDGDLSKWMQRLTTSHVRRYHRHYDVQDTCGKVDAPLQN